MSKKIRVHAKTILFSKSGTWHNYSIDFTVDLKSGRTNFIDEVATVPIFAYMLLHLLSEIYKIKGISPKVEYVQYVKDNFETQNVRRSRQPELEIVKIGKRYILDQEVEGKWLNDINIPSLVQYVLSVADEDYESENYLIHQLCYRYNEEGYRLLNPVNSVVWNYTLE